MPQEKTPTFRSNPGKPLKPTLASNRTAKSPLTPRLANSTTPSSVSDASGRSTVGGIARAHTFSPDSPKTSTPAFIVSNVTPRSSSRVSRVDSTASTPTGTLSPAPHIVEGGRRGTGTLSPAPGQQRRPASVLGAPPSSRSPLLRAQTFGAPAVTRKSPTLSSDHASSKFFHANDKRSPERELVVKKPAVFFHANGDAEAGARQVPASPSPPLSAVSGKSGRSQFFRAQGPADEGGIPPVPTRPSAVRVKVPQLSPPGNARQPPMFFQPLSPGTLSPGSGNIHLSYRKGASQIIRPAQLSPTQADASDTAITPSVAIPSTLTGIVSKPHRRASSLTSIDSGSTGHTPSKELPAVNDMKATEVLQPSVIVQNKDSPGITYHKTTSPDGYFGLGIDAALTHIPDNETPIPAITQISQALHQRTLSSDSIPQSPVKANLGPSDIESANNARRERKVMDLEISNSSLLAINRQLEKEVRRQKAELRRFRRLSRVGRLSSLPESLLARSTGDLNDDDCRDNGIGNGRDLLSSLNEEEYDFSEPEEDDDTSSLSSDEADNMTPEALAAHDAKRIARDSKRLQLDLAKHRELLVDSQKMNQSLRRCMAWTEEMLREGKKQLDHRIRVSDVKLGGRILDPADEGDMDLDPVHEVEEDEDGSVDGLDLGGELRPSLDRRQDDGDDLQQLIAQIEAMSSAGGGTAVGTEAASIADKDTVAADHRSNF